MYDIPSQFIPFEPCKDWSIFWKSHRWKELKHFTPTDTKYFVDKGGLFIRDLWNKCAYSIQYMYVTNSDASSYTERDPEKVILEAEKGKTRKHLDACLDQRS